jgi:sulfide:quinone oxidoreductase
MNKRIVILGGGTGGTLAANRLAQRVDPGSVEIAVVDQDDRHVYQPGLLFVPFGLAEPKDLVRPRHRQLHAGVDLHLSGIDHVDLDTDRVQLADGTVLGFDVLVVASGSVLVPEETEGLTGPGWGDTVGTFYELEAAETLRHQLERFRGGRLVVNVVDMPIKCPVAPLEFSFLADWHFWRHGMRRDVDIALVTPLDGAFTKPVASHELSGLLAAKGIELITEFNTASIDSDARRLVGYDGREVPFDLAVVVPLHGGAPYVGRSPGLGDALGFVPVDPNTLQARNRPNVFAVGDANDVPTSKSGSAAHFQGETLVDNVLHQLRGQPLAPGYDGHTSCFIETGFHKALLIDFNYDTEPLPGHYPGPVGLPLLRESRLNHVGKLAFEWLYWHSMLPGHELPGIASAMPEHGKVRVAS